MLIRISILIGIMMASVQIGSAQRVTLINLDEALDIAIKTNKDYQTYLINQKKTELEFKQSKSHRLPSVNGTFSGQRNIDLATTPLPGEIFGQPGQTVEAQFGQAYNFNAGISISKQLYNREAIIQSKISKHRIGMVEAERSAFEELLREQVGLYYYTGLVAKQAILIGDLDLKSASEIYGLTEDKFNKGLIDIITLNNAKINENTVKQSLNQNRQLENQCLIQLKKLLGIAPTDTLTLEGEIDYNLPEIIIRDQLQSSSEIKMAELQAEQADLQVKLSQSSLHPSLSLSSYFGRQQFRDDLGLGFNSGDWTNYSYLTVGLSIPIFTGFNNRSKIKQSKYSQQVAFIDEQQSRQNSILDDNLLISDYQLSLNDAQVALESYRLYDETQKLTFQKYEEGLISLSAYLSVFEDYIKAENGYLNAVSKLYSYYSQILPRIQP